MNHITIGDMLGVSPVQSEAENIAALQRLWSDDPADQKYKARVRSAIAAQSMEFSEHNVKFGYHYDSSAIIATGDTPQPNPDEMRLYQPSTVPGAAVPHAGIDSLDGERRAIVDLLAPGKYLQLAGEDGADWVTGAQHVTSQLDIPIKSYTIVHIAGDFPDPWSVDQSARSRPSRCSTNSPRWFCRLAQPRSPGHRHHSRSSNQRADTTQPPECRPDSVHTIVTWSHATAPEDFPGLWHVVIETERRRYCDGDANL